MALETIRFDIQDFLKTPEEQAWYLRAALEDGGPALIAAAIGDIAQAMKDAERLALHDVPDDQLTDAHEVELLRRIAENPDDFLLPADAKGRSFGEALPEWAEEIEQCRGGRQKEGGAK
jgi:hypothetical protein